MTEPSPPSDLIHAAAAGGCAAHRPRRFPSWGWAPRPAGCRRSSAFLAHVPPTSGMAFVVILHLSPEQESNAAAVLQRHTALPVTQVTEAVPLAPNQVYVIPPNKQLEVHDGQLQLRRPRAGRGPPRADRHLLPQPGPRLWPAAPAR